MFRKDISEIDLKSYIGISSAGGYKPNIMSQAYLERLFDYFRYAIRLYGTDEERRIL